MYKFIFVTIGSWLKTEKTFMFYKMIYIEALEKLGSALEM